ncbi:hypothetical protein [Actinomadura sp. BRA 177]|uniref:hypothetical protein n=1 Tax=Actinomadura sp. BRA 177 TaxID=2745202 RepID=UPI0020CD3F9A|nr:hypothetical protein [Actinomadura sp. BRA 177]
MLNALLAIMRWLIRTREDTRFCRTQLFGLSRTVLWRLGADLAEAGALDDPMDVLDLTVEEVIGAFDGTLPGSGPCGLRGLVAVRRAERDRHLDAPPPPAQHVAVLASGAAPRSSSIPASPPPTARAGSSSPGRPTPAGSPS